MCTISTSSPAQATQQHHVLHRPIPPWKTHFHKYSHRPPSYYTITAQYPSIFWSIINNNPQHPLEIWLGALGVWSGCAVGVLAPAEGASVALQVLLSALSGARFWCEICPLCSPAGRMPTSGLCNVYVYISLNLVISPLESHSCLFFWYFLYHFLLNSVIPFCPTGF